MQTKFELSKGKKLFTKIHFKYLFSNSSNNNIELYAEHAFESMNKTDNARYILITDKIEPINCL